MTAFYQLTHGAINSCEVGSRSIIFIHYTSAGEDQYQVRAPVDTTNVVKDNLFGGIGVVP